MIIAIANSIGSGMVKATRGANLLTNSNFNDLGSELFVNNDFDGNISGWDDYDYWAYSSVNGASAQALVFNLSGYDDNVLYQEVLTSGKYYRLEGEFLASNFDTTKVDFAIASSETTDYVAITQNTFNEVFLATDDFIGIRAKWKSGSLSVFLLGPVSVKELNPNIASQWTLGTGWSVSDRLIGASTTGNATQTISDLETSTTYEVSFKILSYTGGSVRFRVSRSNGTLTTSGSLRNAVGVYTEQFTNSSTSIDTFKIDANASFTGTIGNISIKKVLD